LNGRCVVPAVASEHELWGAREPERRRRIDRSRRIERLLVHVDAERRLVKNIRSDGLVVVQRELPVDGGVRAGAGIQRAWDDRGGIAGEAWIDARLLRVTS